MSIRVHSLIYLLVVVAGCSDGAARVSGIVTLDGEPLKCNDEMYGTVSFYQESGSGAPAVGLIDEAGRYAMKTGASRDLAPGKYAISVAVKRISKPTVEGEMPAATLITPQKYSSVVSSGLREDVTPGDNTFDLALSSQPAP